MMLSGGLWETHYIIFHSAQLLHIHETNAFNRFYYT